MESLKSNAELRELARERLHGNWGKAIFAIVIITAVSTLVNYVTAKMDFGWIGSAIAFILSGPFTAGTMIFFLKLIRKEKVSIGLVFSGFRRLTPFFFLYLLQFIFIILWMLLLIVPGIIASIRYSQSFYLMIDHPEITAREAISRSKAMMEGRKSKYFLLQLSFIGWFLLCIPTLGIGFLWLIPYANAAQAAFYEDLREQSEKELLPPKVI